MTVLKKKYKTFLFVLFPNLRQVEVAAVATSKVYRFVKKNRRAAMKFPVKLAIASACAFVFIILVGFVIFPKVIKSQIKKMVNLKPGTEIRDMFLKVPFPLTFNVYVFSVLNPEEINGGGIPKLKEIGPFCFEEWKTKINVEDVEGDDSISYEPVDTFLKANGPGCKDLDTEITVPHPMILGLVNTVFRQKPGALTLANKAIKSIWSNPTSLFITATARELLFDGLVINCGVSDFAGKAICANLKAEPSLVPVNENELLFSLLGPKNGTAGKRIKAYRGSQDFHYVGKIVNFDGKARMEVWNNTKCDAILGTDGTIFPPFLTKQEGLASFSPDLCRSLIAQYEKHDKYDGIPVSSYSASLGDQSKNPDEKCFCTTPDTCLKKGLMDLYKCAKIPLYASLPHFYDSHESYLKGVKGLKPEAEKHEIRILFEATSGSPLYARKRLQFNMPLDPNPKVELFHNFTPTVFPIFWIEEGVELNNTYTKPLKDLFLLKKIIGVMKYLILVGSIAGFAAAGYLNFHKTESMNVSSVHKVEPEENGNGTKSAISTVFDGNHLEGRINGGYEKY